MAAEAARCTRHGHLACVAVIDIDDLKEVNDRDGHAAGDELIRSTASAVQRSLRRNDAAFRVGGDEFVVVATETSPEAVDLIGERLGGILADAGIRASVGVAVKQPDDTFAATLARADEAMYASKRARR